MIGTFNGTRALLGVEISQDAEQGIVLSLSAFVTPGVMSFLRTEAARGIRRQFSEVRPATPCGGSHSLPLSPEDK